MTQLPFKSVPRIKNSLTIGRSFLYAVSHLLRTVSLSFNDTFQLFDICFKVTFTNNINKINGISADAMMSIVSSSTPHDGGLFMRSCYVKAYLVVIITNEMWYFIHAQLLRCWIHLKRIKLRRCSWHRRTNSQRIALQPKILSPKKIKYERNAVMQSPQLNKWMKCRCRLPIRHCQQTTNSTPIKTNECWEMCSKQIQNWFSYHKILNCQQMSSRALHCRAMPGQRHLLATTLHDIAVIASPRLCRAASDDIEYFASRQKECVNYASGFVANDWSYF